MPPMERPGGREPRARLRAGAVLWTALGALFVALGAAGVVLPLVPTTPFLLLAGTCFLRGSPRLHRKLHESRVFGPYLVQWEVEHTIPPRAKVKALFLVVVTFSISVAVVDRPVVRGVLVVLGSVLLLFLAGLRTAPPLEEREPAAGLAAGQRDSNGSSRGAGSVSQSTGASAVSSSSPRSRKT